jgi:hypothetical protein
MRLAEEGAACGARHKGQGEGKSRRTLHVRTGGLSHTQVFFPASRILTVFGGFRWKQRSIAELRFRAAVLLIDKIL